MPDLTRHPESLERIGSRLRQKYAFFLRWNFRWSGGDFRGNPLISWPFSCIRGCHALKGAWKFAGTNSNRGWHSINRHWLIPNLEIFLMSSHESHSAWWFLLIFSPNLVDCYKIHTRRSVRSVILTIPPITTWRGPWWGFQTLSTQIPWEF